jgi:hypothetical protein
MRESDAETAILLEWRTWAPRNFPSRPELTKADAQMFFAYLQTEKPQLLAFETTRDKWQVVHGWLLGRAFVVD